MRPRPRPVLALALAALGCAAASCHPSSSVRKASPVANLQSYRQIAVRVDGAPQARQHVGSLAAATVQNLQQACQFNHVFLASQAPGTDPDLVLDLNILRAFRGGSGVIRNVNQATVDVSLVLSDGINDELLGSAEIRGTSGQVRVSGISPEGQAVSAVAKRVAAILSQSGCTGERVARAPEEPVEPQEPTEPSETPGDAGAPEPAVSEADMEQAEAANDAGKEKFRSGDVQGARASFEEAISLYSDDPRYHFNLCLAQESLKDYDGALVTCQHVLEMNPPQRLVDKARLRIDIIEKKTGRQK